MCTVIFIPNKNGNYFASLRDENPMRAKALVPTVISKNNTQFLSPIDANAGGTWLGANQYGNVIILLNGAFENHIKEEKYRKSRGLIVAELLAATTPVEQWNLLSMQDVEPYTLIVFSNSKLFQLVWDGNKKHFLELNGSKAYIWSSATLYNKKAKEIREQLFKKWIADKPTISRLSLLNFFHSSTNSENGFIINRGENLKTLSFSFIELLNNKANFSYYDFETNVYTNEQIEFAETYFDL